MAILIDDLITSIEVELEAAERTASKAANEVKFILKRASDEGRANLAPDEDVRVQDLFAARDKAKADIKGIQAKLENARKAKAEEVEEREAAREVHETGVPRPRDNRQQKASVTVGRNERTYRADTDRKGIQFLRDISRAFLFNDAESQFRLSQHMQEERVERGAQMMERAAGDSTTANWAGLTVPQYLTDMYAPSVAALRPFADICNHHDLPPNGMTVNISQVTTPSAVSLQTAELAAGGIQSIDDTLLTENVQTATGQVTLSRQAIDRGTGIEEVTMQDLFRRYATTLDNTLITQATTGLSALSQLVTWTTGSPTAALLYPKILNAAANVEAALLAQATPNYAVMHSRRWYWLASQLGSTWPLINSFPPSAYPQSGGTLNPDSSYSKGTRGMLPSGLAVVVDNNIATNLGAGTNQDQLYVVAADECHLWESPDAPVFIRAEQPKAASLGVLLVLYGYFAYSFRRYSNAVSAVDGTGMVTPVF